MESLWYQLPDFKIDIKKFADYVMELEKRPSTAHEAAITGKIYGWAITSRAKSEDFGLNKIDYDVFIPLEDMIHPTKNCFGYAREILLSLGMKGLFASRARILALTPGAQMSFHRDEYIPSMGTSWRLHIPIISTPEAKLQWLIDDKVIETHLPPTGHAYMINVSEPHKPINNSSDQVRYHFICSLVGSKK